tara:strand:+ start:94782 stop:95177 length:396 start_codon:yes stop_codon:yes gene_type:complete
MNKLTCLLCPVFAVSLSLTSALASAADTNADSPATATRPATGPQNGMGQQKGGGIGRNRPSFDDFDLNHDGSITDAELNQARAQRIRQNSEAGKAMRNMGNMKPFATLDLNGDNTIDRSEFDAHQKSMMAR